MQRRSDAGIVDSSLVAESGADLVSREIRKAGAPIRLTRLEARLLYLLVRNAGTEDFRRGRNVNISSRYGIGYDTQYG
jgi:hypothetical protein